MPQGIDVFNHHFKLQNTGHLGRTLETAYQYLSAEDVTQILRQACCGSSHKVVIWTSVDKLHRYISLTLNSAPNKIKKSPTEDVILH
ncbi:uncharacterized protein isoform X2 [Castor canadensis]|uniref:Uncharacterized protein isoform X2 n=1 Tax=Castor canadensis TaxID=51338 RepID=A0AC58K2Z4_CASCN